MDTDTAVIPASPMMEALWWVHQRSKNKSVYNLTWPMTADGPIDFAALRVAWQTVVDRHEALRASLHHTDGRIELSVVDHIDVEPQRITIDDPGSVPADALLRKIAEELHERPIALEQAPVARLTLVTVGDLTELVFTVHHALVDGWGVQLLMEEFFTVYATVLAGGTPTFDAEPVSLRESVLDAHAARTDGRWDKSIQHWRTALDGAMTATLVADRHRYTGTGSAGEVLRFALSKEAVDGAAAVAKQYYATPFTVVLAALQTVLALGGAGPDVCSGVVSANRMSKKEQLLIGYVANLLLARNTITGDDTFGEVVERMRDTMWGMLSHQSVPFSLVFGALGESAQSRLQDNIPLIMTYYGPIGSNLRMGETELSLQRAPNRAARTDLGIGVWDSDTGLVFESEHNTGRYDSDTVLRLFHDIDAVLVAGADPTRKLSTLEVRSKSGPAYLEHQITAEDLGTTAMPKSAAMDRVRQAWTDVIGAEPAGPDEDFFAMGGRSLKVVQFASAIESDTGVPLDMVRWLTEPTPRRAAEQVAAGDRETAGDDSTLVELRAGSGPHVHLLPGAGGTVQDYRDLVAALPEDWRITLSQERAPLESVTEMAQRFGADLDSRPDLLVGWSMGGQIAFEMATAYPADTAPAVAVLDSTPPVGYAQDEATRDFIYGSFAAGIAGAYGVTLDGSPARTTEGDPELAMRVLAGRIAAASGQPVPAAMLIDRWAIFHRHSTAVVSYVADRPVAATALIVGAGLRDDQVDLWAGRFTPAPRRLRVAADHYGLLRQPAIAEIAAAIGELHATASSRT